MHEHEPGHPRPDRPRPDAMFIYGTLQPGQALWPQLAAFVAAHTPATLDGYELWALPAGYPALVRGPQHHRVSGLLVDLDRARYDEALRRCDELEGFFAPPDPRHDTSLYLRVVETVHTEAGPRAAWVYIMPPARRDRLARIGAAIPHGSWLRWVDP